MYRLSKIPQGAKAHFYKIRKAECAFAVCVIRPLTYNKYSGGAVSLPLRFFDSLST